MLRKEGRDERRQKEPDRNAERVAAAANGAAGPGMPRPIKYAWGVAVTLLVTLSLVLDRGSAWMPLVHRAIDLLQTQTAPTENK